MSDGVVKIICQQVTKKETVDLSAKEIFGITLRILIIVRSQFIHYHSKRETKVTRSRFSKL